MKEERGGKKKVRQRGKLDQDGKRGEWMKGETYKGGKEVEAKGEDKGGIKG